MDPRFCDPVLLDIDMEAFHAPVDFVNAEMGLDNCVPSPPLINALAKVFDNVTTA